MLTFLFLHQGVECLRSQFRCHDDSGCIEKLLLCDGFSDCQDSSDEETCLSSDDRYSETLSDSDINSAGKFGKRGSGRVWLCRYTGNSNGIFIRYYMTVDYCLKVFCTTFFGLESCD